MLDFRKILRTYLVDDPTGDLHKLFFVYLYFFNHILWFYLETTCISCYERLKIAVFKIDTHAFFISNTFISNNRLKLAKNQANAKQHPETEFLLFENYSRSLYTSSFRNNGINSKNKPKNKCACIHEILRLILMKMMKKMKKGHIDTTYIDLVLDMNTNIRGVSVW